MKYNVLTADQVDLLRINISEEAVVNATQDVLMAPVLCTDCGQYVPLGWVEFGTVKCEKNLGAPGVRYGHRTTTEVYTSTKDSIVNAALRGLG